VPKDPAALEAMLDASLTADPSESAALETMLDASLTADLNESAAPAATLTAKLDASLAYDCAAAVKPAMPVVGVAPTALVAASRNAEYLS